MPHGLQSQEAPRVQASLFIPEPRKDPKCDHVGTSREQQRTVWNETEAICGACGARLDEGDGR